MSAPTTVVRITHSWCPTCQGGTNRKARCSTLTGQSIWPANVREQPCIVCEWLTANLACEWCR